MILNLLVIVMIVLPTFFWATSGKGRGLYSAFLNMVCVLCAGAIGFGMWEAVAHALLGMGGSGGLIDSIAWGAGLLIPFVVSLALLRAGVDIMLGANVHFGTGANLAGGIAFGLVASFITTGVVVTGLQYMGTGRAFLGYSAVTDEGHLVYDKPLWVPADKFTVAFYEHLSLAPFRTATPLALAMPSAHEQGAMSRLVYADNGGVGRFGLNPNDFEILGRYSVQGSGAALLADIDRPERAQTVKLPDGSTPPAGSTIEGVAVRLRSGAVERSGSQVVFGAGQARLVVKRDGTDNAMGVHPIAILAPPEGGGGFTRFRFDADEIFIPTVGGAAENVFIFEFVVPPGYAPTYLTLKNARKDMPVASGAAPFDGWEERDELLVSGELLTSLGIEMGGVSGDIDATGTVTLDVQPGSRAGDVITNPGLPDGFSVAVDQKGGLVVSENGSDVVGGEHTFEQRQLQNRGKDRKLVRDRFGATRTTGVVQLVIATPDEGLTPFGRAIATADQTHAPLLLSSTGETFQPVGYVNVDGDLVTIRFTPNRPLRTVRDLPIQLSEIKRDQDLILVYRPTKGARLVGFVMLDARGDGTQPVTFDPPLPVR